MKDSATTLTEGMPSNEKIDEILKLRNKEMEKIVELRLRGIEGCIRRAIDE